MFYTKQENIEYICKHVAETIADKNADYGGAYAEAVEKFGYQYALSKIFEKYFRIVALTTNKNRVEGESLKDALLDCMGYCALYIDQLEQRASADAYT